MGDEQDNIQDPVKLREGRRALLVGVLQGIALMSLATAGLDRIVYEAPSLNDTAPQSTATQYPVNSYKETPKIEEALSGVKDNYAAGSCRLAGERQP